MMTGVQAYQGPHRTMTLPIDILGLAVAADTSVDEAEVARRVERAAGLVQEFAGTISRSALEALLVEVTAEIPAGAAAARIRELGQEVTRQSGILHEEVGRFLSLATPR